MADVPAATGVSTPEEEPMVAVEVVPLIHVPPGAELVNVTEASEQIFVKPEVRPG